MTSTPSLWNSKACSLVCIPFTAFTPDGENVIISGVEAQAKFCIDQARICTANQYY
jgi:hypothetical protein